jgi:hypothetical protein
MIDQPLINNIPEGEPESLKEYEQTLCIYTHQYSDCGVLRDCNIIHDKPDDYGMIVVVNRFGEYVLCSYDKVINKVRANICQKLKEQ